jgi:hypothetical protein
MAQYLNVRERRACLSALADLASGGAKGLLTSRPNYFSETEELHVFESLYQTLYQHNYHISLDDKKYLDTEKAIDSVVVKYILERYERFLRDLTPEQTESLVVRKLQDDQKGQEVVLGILRSVFRTESDGEKRSLSGKPVIITYLLDLIDEFKSTHEPYPSELNEWLR